MTGAPAKPRLLLVDDEATARLITCAALEREGFVVESASSGTEALARLAAADIDCVLLDVVMPELDGFQVCGAIRAASWGESLPVLMLTGLEDLGTIRRAYEVGANDFAPKTLQPLLLAHRIQFLLWAHATSLSLRESERRLLRAQQLAHLGHWEWQPAGGASSLSATVREILGLEEEAELDYPRFCERVHPDDLPLLHSLIQESIRTLGRYSLDHRIVQPGGRVRVVHHEGAVARAGAADTAVTVLSVIKDITERHRAEERLRYLAYHDDVTGFANRLRCIEFLSDAMRPDAKGRPAVAVAVLELSGFGKVATTLGDRRVNELMRTVAERLRETVGSGTDPVGELLLGWLGAGKLAIAAAGLGNADRLVPIVRRVQAVATEPFAIAGTEVHFGAPAGIATADDVSADAETLLMNAGAAMQHARRSGPLACIFFAQPMQATPARRLALEADLRRGLPRDELWVAYQPRIALEGMSLASAEALVRWTHPWRGVVRPDEFVAIAEETGLMREIGSMVLHAAARDAAAWQGAYPGVKVSVNVSGVQLRDIGFLAELDSALAESGLDPRLLEIEITESLLVENSELAARVLAEVRARGVLIALDDFGTGYSALAYLRRFPIDVVKIDRSFVRDILTSSDAATLVQAIIRLTHDIGLRSVAEGVERLEQANRLREYGCNEVQGYFFSQPRPLAGFLDWAMTSPALSATTKTEAPLLLAATKA